MSSARILSASQVDMYRQCSLRWHYRHVDYAPEESRSGALVVGTAVDVALKGAIHLLRSGEATPDQLKPADLVRKAWDAEITAAKDVPVLWGERNTAEKGLATATGLVESFLRLPDLPGRISGIEAVDLRFELPVSDPTTGCRVPGLTLTGILDIVERAPDGRLRALDLKTASSRAGYDSDDLRFHLQGSLYVWALREIHGDKASDEMAFTVGFKTKDPCREDRTVFLGEPARRRALLTVIHARRGMDLGLAFPQPSFLCGSCPNARRCCSWADSPNAALPRDPFAPRS